MDFLGEAVALCPPEQEIHFILDNLAAHKTKLVAAFLEPHPTTSDCTFTPTYVSWISWRSRR